MNDITNQQPYDNLTPDLMLDALESIGYEVSGSLLALNSYENRVYQVGLNNGKDIITKFYRPGRWSDDAILEEHAFSLELAENVFHVPSPPFLAATYLRPDSSKSSLTTSSPNTGG